MEIKVFKKLTLTLGLHIFCFIPVTGMENIHNGVSLPLYNLLIQDAKQHLEKCPQQLAVQCEAAPKYLGAIKHLLEAGANPNENGTYPYFPLHGAIKDNNLELVKLLINYGADVNTILTPHNGATALHEAAKKPDVDILKTLINAGALVDEVDKEGETALHRACRYGNFDNAKLLLEWGANPNSRNCIGYKPIHVAASSDFHSKVEIASLLFEHGVAVDSSDTLGRTALHYACMGNKPQLVKFLIEKGANKVLEDKMEYTPFDYAVDNSIGKDITQTINFMLTTPQYKKVLRLQNAALIELMRNIPCYDENSLRAIKQHLDPLLKNHYDIKKTHITLMADKIIQKIIHLNETDHSFLDDLDIESFYKEHQKRQLLDMHAVIDQSNAVYNENISDYLKTVRAAQSFAELPEDLRTLVDNTVKDILDL